jgi:ferredoxin-NADP reductase
VARAAVRRRLTWQVAEVVANERESARSHRLSLDVPDWSGHLPGQHLDVRLTAPDGYTAQRSYSIASSSDRAYVQLVVERLPDGEVSPYLTDELRVGDQLELRGPIGGYFVWHRDIDDAPVQLIAGGSGVVPFLAMLEHHAASASSVPMRLLYSARSIDDVIGGMQLSTASDADVTITLSRTAPDDWQGARGRIDGALLLQHVVSPDRMPRVYICGPTSFVETATMLMLELGHDAAAIRTERFGATGGTS